MTIVFAGKDLLLFHSTYISPLSEPLVLLYKKIDYYHAITESMKFYSSNAKKNQLNY